MIQKKFQKNFLLSQKLHKGSKEFLIKAIVFDIGGVLDLDDFFYEKMCRDLGVNFNEFLKEARKYIEGFRNRRITAKQLTLKIGKKFDVNPDYLLKKWLYYTRGAFNKNVKLEKIIKDLKKKYKIVTLTNVSEIHNVIRKEKNIYKHFHFKICSCDVGMSKPNIKIYKLLIKKLKINSEEIIFIDDVEKNLIPARKLGINTIQFKNNKQLIKDLRKFGVKI